MIRALILALAVLASPVWATVDGWPALYDVTGVASGDVLNIRAGPSSAAEIIGGFEYDAERIEVIRPDDNFEWGLVNIAEGVGWVSLRFLVPQPGQWWGEFPAIRQCFGTEPFWAVGVTGDTFQLDAPENTASGRILERWTSLNRRDNHAMTVRLDHDSDADIVIMLTTDRCTDGMSDREYGIRLDMLFRGAIDRELVSGCCSIAPPEASD